jgi:hypothetical protein
VPRGNQDDSAQIVGPRLRSKVELLTRGRPAVPHHVVEAVLDRRSAQASRRRGTSMSAVVERSSFPDGLRGHDKIFAVMSRRLGTLPRGGE